jgi:hypothetical protein
MCFPFKALLIIEQVNLASLSGGFAARPMTSDAVASYCREFRRDGNACTADLRVPNEMATTGRKSAKRIAMDINFR